MKFVAIPFLFLFVLSSCTKTDSPEPGFVRDIDPAFEIYWQSFQEDVNARNLNLDDIIGRDITIQFDVLEADIHGICNEIGGDEIGISRAHWDTIDHQRREQLIYHELGHCLLSRLHEQPGSYFLSLSVAHTMMIPSSSGSNCIMDYYDPKWREYYIDELLDVANEPAWLADRTLELAVFDNSKETLHERSDLIKSTEASDYSYDVEDEEQLQVVVAHPAAADYHIRVNNYTFAYQEGAGFRLMEGSKQLGDIVDFFYRSQLTSTGENVKFTMRYVDDHVYFYINDFLLHFREQSKPADLDISLQAQVGEFEAVLTIEKL